MSQPAQLLLVFLLLACPASSSFAQLRGHGGPVRAIAVSSDGAHAISGSFDTTAIRWSLPSGVAQNVLRFHESAVNAVAFLKDGRVATGGEDGSIAIWQLDATKPMLILRGHTAPVVGLVVSPDGETLASASWDSTVRLWALKDGASQVLEGHSQNVNGVAFTPDGRALVSVGYDLTLRIWFLGANAPTPTVITLPSPLNSVAVAPDGSIVTAGASGKVYFLSANGVQRGEVEAANVPIIALAISKDGRLVAASSIRGGIAVINRVEQKIEHTLVGPGLPAWAVTFLPDGRTLLTGGADRLIRRWDAATGEHFGEVPMNGPADVLAAYEGDAGAQVFRGCIACHTLNMNEGPRAGPTLDGIFGRRIATLPGYDFSPALKELDIVWTTETLSKLFEVGPAAYTPGTKMPEQRVGPEDRAALVRFLEKATRH